ncbi:myeloid-associated differentiation marker-like [Pseudonaja textilis]|uniref:Myeloid-associated differentiation marker-like n=1 Tax=Pseudonaja textilis TaxID=8673 RepID=A0A670Y8S5_PSETE|nr:myeloid-associated differentiation marker-like [Pseudonaja textilis]
MPALRFNGRSLISPLGIVRLLEIFFSCTAFSLAAVYQSYGGNYGAWSMFTWCFCFIVSVFVVTMELISLNAALPLSWQDFTSAFSMLATLMIFTTSIVYPATFLPSCKGNKCGYEIGATVMSSLCFIAYAVEVGLTRAKAGELSNFLTTIPGLLKVFEAYVACLIFSLLDKISYYRAFPGLEWCVAVYSICFILTMVIIILTIGRCLGSLPIPVEKTLVAYNILAVLMYLTVVVVWPLYSFRDNPRPPCNSPHDAPCAAWDNQLGITFLSFFNLIAYIVDFAYSYKMVFVTTPA